MSLELLRQNLMRRALAGGIPYSVAIGMSNDELSKNQSDNATPAWKDQGEFRLLENLMFTPDIPIALIFVAVIARAFKTPEGRKQVIDFAEKFLETQARMVVALAQAGSGNMITAWAYSHLIAMMLEQNYMIRKGGAKSLVDGMNWITAANVLSNLLQGFSSTQSIAFDDGGVKGKGLLGTLGALSQI